MVQEERVNLGGGKTGLDGAGCDDNTYVRCRPVPDVINVYIKDESRYKRTICNLDNFTHFQQSYYDSILTLFRASSPWTVVTSSTQKLAKVLENVIW